MRLHHPRSVALLLLVAGAACGGSSSSGGGGFTSYLEAKEPRVTCPAPTLVNGGTNPAVDPGLVCVGAPRPSALPAVPADATHGWQDLGEHQVGAMVDVVVPAGTASLLLVEQLVSAGPPGQVTEFVNPDRSTSIVPNLAVIGELWNPAGQLVYSDLRDVGLADPSGELVTVMGAGAVVGSVAFPSTSAGLQATAAGVAPGTWRVMVNDYAHECWLAAQPTPPPGLVGFSCTAASRTTETYRLYALTTPAASGGATAIPARGTIDVAFHLVDDPAPIIGITAAQALTHQDTRRMVESLGWFLSGAGVCLGTVTFYDEPAWARERFASHTSADDATPCGNLPQLLATSTPGAPTLDLFLLPFLVQAPGAQGRIVGVDGTIPGPASINGTIASGAAVSAEDLSFSSGSCPTFGSGVAPRISGTSPCGADLVAIVAAHEAGHFLGLYHSTEAGGAAFDPLADTPHCEYQAACGVTPAVCAGGVPGALCLRGSRVRGGGANLMFWQLHEATVGFLSPEQARVVRSSPLVRSP